MADEKLGTKGLSDTIKKLRDDINKSSDTGIGKDEFIKAQVKAESIETKLFEAEQAGDDARAAAIRDQLSGVREALERGPMNLATLNKRMEELDAINANLEKAAEREENQQKILEQQLARDETTRGLKDLNDSLKSQTERLENTASLEKSLENLQGFFGASQNETSQQLQAAFEQATADLAAAEAVGDEQARALALQQLEAIQEGAESEEKRREAQKALDEQNDALLKTANGVEGLGNKFDDFASTAAGGVGFLATLAGLALLFLDPQKFAELIGKVIENITNVFSGIYQVFTGDIEGGLGLISENLGIFAALLGGLVLFLGGPLLKGMSMVLKIARVVRGFVLMQWVPGMIAAMSGMATSFMAMVAPFAPIIAIAAGVIAIIGGLYYGFQKLRESLGPGAGIMDTLKVAALYLVDFLSMLVNAITFIPRKIIGLIGPTAAKFLFGDDVDTSAIDALAAGLKTNRGAEAAAALRAENEARAAEEPIPEPQMPTFDQALEGDGTFDATLNSSGFNLDNLMDENFDLALEGQSAPNLTSVVQNNSPSNRKTTNTTIIEQPTSPGMGILSGLSFAR